MEVEESVDDVNTHEPAHENTTDSGCFGTSKALQIGGMILSSSFCNRRIFCNKIVSRDTFTQTVTKLRKHVVKKLFLNKYV